MSYTLAEAANATGVNKTTILKAIQSGKIIGTKDELGKWHVEPAELHRLYPAVAERGACSQTARRSAAPDEANLAAQIEAPSGEPDIFSNSSSMASIANPPARSTRTRICTSRPSIK